eukprot:scaffold75883_cov31-Tisochrysis_lutea.AAC.4
MLDDASAVAAKAAEIKDTLHTIMQMDVDLSTSSELQVPRRPNEVLPCLLDAVVYHSFRNAALLRVYSHLSRCLAGRAGSSCTDSSSCSRGPDAPHRQPSRPRETAPLIASTSPIRPACHPPEARRRSHPLPRGVSFSPLPAVEQTHSRAPPSAA